MQAPNTNKEKRTFEKGVDMDSAIIGIEDGFARYMLNCLVDEGVNITNIKGNLVAEFEDGFTFFEDNPNYDYRCIGSKYDPIYQKTYFFVVASDGASSPTYYSFIFEYDIASGIVYVVCDETWSDILDFDFDELITGVDVAFINTTDPLLYWTQEAGLRKINIIKAKLLYSSAGTDPLGYSAPDLQIIELIKYPPRFRPDISIHTDDSIEFNNINQIFFQFAYRYIYDDYEKSVASPISGVNVSEYIGFQQLIYETGTGDPAYLITAKNFNNCIDLVVNRGFETVSKIEIFVREKTSTNATEINFDWKIYDSLIISETTFDVDGNFTYKFYNNKVGKLVTQKEANQLFDNVPLSAKALKIGENNLLYVANETEGFNLEPIDIDTETKFNNVGILCNLDSDTQFTDGLTSIITANGFSLVGTAASIPYDVIRLKLTYLGDSTYVYYQITPDDVILTLDPETSYPNPLNDHFVSGYNTQLSIYGSVATLVSTGPSYNKEIQIKVGSTNIVAEAYIQTSLINHFSELKKFVSFKAGLTHKLGICYSDAGGRLSSVQPFEHYVPFFTEQEYIDQIAIDDPNRGLNTYPTIQISINHTPPLWADRYHIVKSKNRPDFYQIKIVGIVVGSYWGVEIGTMKVKVNFLNDKYIFKDDTFLSYSFAEGDTFRFMGFLNWPGLPYTQADLFISPDQVFDVTLPVISYDDATGYAVVPYNDSIYDKSGSGFLMVAELRHKPIDSPLYYEIFSDEIGNAGLSTRYHKGNVTNQNDFTSVQPAISDLLNGDVFFRKRAMGYDPGGGGLDTTYLQTVFIEDPNYSDFPSSAYSIVDGETTTSYAQSAVTSLGRPNEINENFRQVTRENTVWFSGALNPESNLNGLSSFPDGQFRDYSQSYGSIQKMVSVDRALKIGMELRWAWIPISQQVNASGAEQTFTLNSSTVLTEMIYYEEKRGVGKHPESVVEFAGAIYGLDPITGCIYRISRDGFTIISDVKNQQGNYLVRQSLYDAIKAHTGNFWGGFNERRNSYEINIGGTVMVWDEEGNSWVGGRSYDAECFGSAGVDLVSFYNGRLYLHEANELRNNFYGVQYTSKVWVPGNWMDFKKIYKSLILRSETIWYAYDILNDIGQKSIIDKLRFSKREGMWYAAFRRDMNTVNVVNPIVDGKQMRDTVILLKMENDSVEYEWLNFVIINQIESK